MCVWRIYAYHHDHRGSMHRVTDLGGNIVKTLEYDAFGNTLKDEGDVEHWHRYQEPFIWMPDIITYME